MSRVILTPDVMVGRRFGRLVVVEHAGTTSYGHSKWLCQCDCGKLSFHSGSRLNSGGANSCGCLKLERVRQMGLSNKKHGMKGTPQYQRWQRIKNTCNDPNNQSYYMYGGRGIKVCERWLSFENFHADMGDAPSGTTIGRIDNDGDYCPENCRWETPRQQANNKRNTFYVTFQGIKLPLMEWIRRFNSGIGRSAVLGRLNRGWPIEEAFTKPTLRERNL